MRLSASPSSFGSISRFARMRHTASPGTSMPSTPFTRDRLTVSGRFSMLLPVFLPAHSSVTVPAPSSSVKCRARFIASTTVYSSVPFSKCALASVRFPSARALRRMLSRANFAASKTTAVVVSLISELRPPMMPARPTGFSPSQIRRLLSLSVNSCSSRVTSFSPSFAVRTTMRSPDKSRRSKACIGCPSSSIT